MEERRSTWQSWHVRAEAQRQVRAVQVPTDKVDQLVELLVDEVLHTRSVSLTRRTTALASRCVASDRRFRVSTRLPDPTCSPPPGFWPPSSVSSRPRAAPAAVPGRRHGGEALLESAANGNALDAGRPLWFVPCAPPGRGCGSRSRPPAPEDHRHAHPGSGVARQRRPVVEVGAVGRRGCATRDATGVPAETLASSPGPSTTPTCPTGRNGSAGQRW